MFLRDVTLADFVQRPQIRAALARQYVPAGHSAVMSAVRSPRAVVVMAPRLLARLAGYLPAQIAARGRR